MAAAVRAQAGLWAAGAVGMALRLYQLRGQVLVDDEWHAVHALLRTGSYWRLATEMGATDRCIPLTLLYKLIADTVGLSEWSMRLPSLLCGGAAVVVLPWLMARWIGWRPASILAWLLAISPMAVFYSRYARPYSITMLCGALGILAFYRWWEGGGRRWRGAYVACVVVVGYSHLVALPAVVAPLLFAAGARRRRPGAEGRSLREVASAGGLAVAGLGCLLAAPLSQHPGALVHKLASPESGYVTWHTAMAAFGLLVGTGSAAWWAVVGGVAAVGAVVLGRAQRRWTAYVGLVALCQLVSLLVLRPVMLRAPFVLARYSLVLLPFLLAAVAVGLATLSRRERLGYLGDGVVAVVLAGMVVAGPLPWIYAWPNDFTNHASYQADYRPTGYFETFRPQRIPAFYTRLARAPRGSMTIVEAPWYYYYHPFAYYQRLHGQRVKIGFLGARGALQDGEVPVGDSRFAFRNGVHIGRARELRRAHATYVVLHRDLARESGMPYPYVPVDVSGWRQRFERTYGAPAYEDDQVVVFRVDGRREGRRR
jgi:Dolichyl-phosphate-mannose-protein mannosyltransferase